MDRAASCLLERASADVDEAQPSSKHNDTMLQCDNANVNGLGYVEGSERPNTQVNCL